MPIALRNVAIAQQLEHRHTRRPLGEAVVDHVRRRQLSVDDAKEVAALLKVAIDPTHLSTAAGHVTGSVAYGSASGPSAAHRRLEPTRLSVVDLRNITQRRPIESIEEMPAVLAGLKGKVLFVTDLDYTVMTTESALGRDAWYDDLVERKVASGLSKAEAYEEADTVWVDVQKHAAMRPIEQETPKVIAQLRDMAAMTIAETARDLRLVDTTPKQLQQLDLDLSSDAHPAHDGALSDHADFRKGVLTIEPGQDKGEHLVRFLDRFGLAFDHVVMLDDKARNLTDVARALGKRKERFHGCLYLPGPRLDKTLDLAAARALEDAPRGLEVIEDTWRRALADRPEDVRRETLPPRPELAGVPHTLNQGPDDYPIGAKTPIVEAAWRNKWNEPLYGPAVRGTLENIVIAPRMGGEEMMRVAHQVPDPTNAQRAFAVLTNANGHAHFVALDGPRHDASTSFTPVRPESAPLALREWHAAHLARSPAPSAGVVAEPLPAPGAARDTLIDEMVTSQIALSGTARRSPELLRKVTANLRDMNRHVLDAVSAGRPLTIEDFELLNGLATRGKSHYGDEIETVRGVARGFSRNVLDGDALKRIQNNEHIESTCALDFSPPHIAAQGTLALVDAFNAVHAGSSLEDIAATYQRIILTHPFSDGTGRTSFCLLDGMLVKSGRRPLPHSEESGIPLFKTVPELACELERLYGERP